jgi:ubiquitin C-terminal hydrolase
MILGFPNFGNTCWLNACVQFLLSSPTFCTLLTKLNHTKQGSATQFLYQISSSNEIGHVHSAIRNLGLLFQADGRPQDSNEALMWLVDRIHNENIISSSLPSNSNSVITQVYKHFDQHMSLIKTYMHGITEFITSDGERRFEPFLTLFMSIPEQLRFINLDDEVNCLVKQYNVISLPKILFITLPKEDHVELEYSNEIIIDQYRYHLRALLFHYGNSFGGHYVCAGKRENGKWFLFDDHNYVPVHDVSHINKTLPKMVLLERID